MARIIVRVRYRREGKVIVEVVEVVQFDVVLDAKFAAETEGMGVLGLEVRGDGMDDIWLVRVHSPTEQCWAGVLAEREDVACSCGGEVIVLSRFQK
jgi:hypothetical protein